MSISQSTCSLEKEERKRFRRKRAEERCSNKFKECRGGDVSIIRGESSLQSKCHSNSCKVDKTTTLVGTNSNSSHLIGSIDEQIMQAISHLEKLKEETISKVANFTITADFNESNRRKVESEQQLERESMINQHHVNSQSQMKELESSWESLDSITHPSELFDCLQNIKSSYDSFLGSKNGIIEKLRTQLMDNDNAYVLTLNEYRQASQSMRNVMDEEVKIMQKAYDDQLRFIEELYIKDRNLLLENQSSELNLLVKQKDQMGIRQLVSIDERRNHVHGVIKQSQKVADDEYKELKQELQAKARRLECELEQARSRYHVDAFRIEHEHGNLEKRISDKEDLIKKKKKKSLMYKEGLTTTITQASINEDQQKKKKLNLETDCMRLEGQYDTLLNKLHRFEIVDSQMYSSILSMYKDEMWSLNVQIDYIQDEINQILGLESTSLSPCEFTEDISKSKAQGDNGYEEIKDSESSYLVKLYDALHEYHDILEKREKAKIHVREMKEQNLAMKSTIDKLLTEDINNDLIVKPLCDWNENRI